MTETQQLVAALKRELRVRHLTYRDVAKALRLSEPSVKRLFSSGRFTLDRLAALTSLLGLTLAELVRDMPGVEPQLRQLAADQEAELVSDPKLLLVCVCALNHWTPPDMLATYPCGRRRIVLRHVFQEEGRGETGTEEPFLNASGRYEQSVFRVRYCRYPLSGIIKITN